MLMSRARAEEEEEDQEGQRAAAVVYMRVECMLAAGRASRTRLVSMASTNAQVPNVRFITNAQVV